MARVVVVGAGMAGLVAGRNLQRAGIEVTILDKGRRVGGRMATRTIGPARFDHGAQHFSARTAQFLTEVGAWIADGTASEWFRSQSITRPERGVEPRYVGAGGMRRVPERLAVGLDVRTSTVVGRIFDDAVVTNDDHRHHADGVVLTAPIPQLLALVGSGPTDIPGDLTDRLRSVRYRATLAVMAELDGPAGLVDGHVTPGSDVAWIADNEHKGTSPVPAVTIHSSAEFAAAHLEAEPDSWVDRLVAAAQLHLSSRVVSAVGHRWRYAEPVATFDDGCVVLDGRLPIVLAGEVFAGARVEGAYSSGAAAASSLVERLTI